MPISPIVASAFLVSCQHLMAYSFVSQVSTKYHDTMVDLESVKKLPGAMETVRKLMILKPLRLLASSMHSMT
eukprot:379690-Hanusia_phi.AAC.1